MQDDSGGLPDSLRTDSNSENGQGDGICTRTVRVTGGDANCYITTLIKLEPRVGLAPIRPGLKDRLLDLLCIHGLKFDLRPPTNSSSYSVADES